MDEEYDSSSYLEGQADEFLAEMNAWQRVGGADIGLGLGGAISLKKSGYTEEEKFKFIVVITISLINKLDIEDLTVDKKFSGDRIVSRDATANLLNQVRKVPDFQYKNPSAFVLGYLVAVYSDYGTLSIDKDVLKTVFKIYKDIEDELMFTAIEESDIIRYTRLCLINKIK